MKMRLRYLVVVLLALAAVAAFVGKRLLYPARSLHAATIWAPTAQSYLVIPGVGDQAATNRDGQIVLVSPMWVKVQ
jgi:hypothetical protein